MHPETPQDPAVEQTASAGRASTTVVRETLTGDRACTTCFHPLLGRTIEREPTTNLFFVRCGECGTATALAEYPTAAPWIRRIKTVVSAGLIASLLAALLLLAGFAGGFATAASMISAEESGVAAQEAWMRASPLHSDPQDGGAWTSADKAWLATAEGRAALSASRFSANAAEPLSVMLGLGLVPLIPLSILISGIALRRGALVRMIAAAAPVAIGCLLIAVPTVAFNASPGVGGSWRQIALQANVGFFLVISTLFYSTVAALAALATPALLSLCARAVLPPGDRRLVAWIWEWRGKPVPRDD